MDAKWNQLGIMEVAGEILVTELRMPKDSRVVGAEFDQVTSAIRLRVCSETFDEVPEGNLIPYVDFGLHMASEEVTMADRAKLKLGAHL